MKSEKGFSLIEILISLVLLSMIAVAFLSALATSSMATLIVDERTTAINLATNQLEHVKTLAYVEGDGTQYDDDAAAVPPGEDYIGYSANITAEPLHDSDDGIQKITVTIEHHNKVVTTLEGYKVDR